MTDLHICLHIANTLWHRLLKQKTKQKNVDLYDYLSCAEYTGMQILPPHQFNSCLQSCVGESEPLNHQKWLKRFTQIKSAAILGQFGVHAKVLSLYEDDKLNFICLQSKVL